MFPNPFRIWTNSPRLQKIHMQTAEKMNKLMEVTKETPYPKYSKGRWTISRKSLAICLNYGEIFSFLGLACLTIRDNGSINFLTIELPLQECGQWNHILTRATSMFHLLNFLSTHSYDLRRSFFHWCKWKEEERHMKKLKAYCSWPLFTFIRNNYSIQLEEDEALWKGFSFTEINFFLRTNKPRSSFGDEKAFQLQEKRLETLEQTGEVYSDNILCKSIWINSKPQNILTKCISVSPAD